MYSAYKKLLSGLFLLLFLSQSAFSQADKYKPLVDQRYYVVLGTFRYVPNAERFGSKLRMQGVEPKFGRNPETKLIYVYCYAGGKEDAIQKWEQYYAMPDFTDAWVYHHRSPNSSMVAQQDKPLFTTKTAPISSTLKPSSTTPTRSEVVMSEATASSERQVQPINEEPENSSEEEPAENTSAPQLVAKKEESKEKPLDGRPETFQNVYETPIEETEVEYVVYFNTFNSTSLKEVISFVEVVDGNKARKIITLPSHEYHQLRIPKASTDNIQLSTQTFGYKKLTLDFNFDKVKELVAEGSDLVRMRGDTIEINMALQRLAKGDKQVMFNVFFHNGAAIMRAQSQYEMNSLLEFMNENPKRKIILHGHTNGSGIGDLWKNPDDEFFSITSKTIKGKGTAKELSQERASIIKRYLVKNGINESRIKIKGWGGKKPIYDPKSYEAKHNARVEVEVISE